VYLERINIARKIKFLRVSALQRKLQGIHSKSFASAKKKFGIILIKRYNIKILELKIICLSN